MKYMKYTDLERGDIIKISVIDVDRYLDFIDNNKYIGINLMVDRVEGEMVTAKLPSRLHFINIFCDTYRGKNFSEVIDIEIIELCEI